MASKIQFFFFGRVWAGVPSTHPLGPDKWTKEDSILKVSKRKHCGSHSLPCQLCIQHLTYYILKKAGPFGQRALLDLLQNRTGQLINDFVPDLPCAI